MSKRMTQEELEKAKETYKKILDLMAAEELTYHQVDWIRGWMYVDKIKRRTSLKVPAQRRSSSEINRDYICGKRSATLLLCHVAEFISTRQD